MSLRSGIATGVRITFPRRARAATSLLRWPAAFAFAAALAGLIPESSGRQVGDSLAKMLLEKIKSRPRTVENFHAVTHWTMTSRSGPGETRPTWEDQTIYLDNLQRVLVKRSMGILNPDGSRSAELLPDGYDLYDGEKTVLGGSGSYAVMEATLVTPPKKKGSKEAVKSPAIPKTAAKALKPGKKDGPIVRLATIEDGPWPPPYGPSALSNPLTYMTYERDQLEKALKSGQAAIKAPQDSGSLYIVTYTQDPRSPDAIRFEVTVDGSRGWNVTKAVGTEIKTARVVSENECDYQKLGDGIWVARSGRSMGMPFDPNNKLPVLEQTFTVETMAVNDPNFSDDVFKVVFEPGTQVTDNRYKVHYVVGAEKALDADLENLAMEAKKTGSGHVLTVDPKLRGRGLYRNLILINATILVVVLAGAGAARRFKRGASGVKPG